MLSAFPHRAVSLIIAVVLFCGETKFIDSFASTPATSQSDTSQSQSVQILNRSLRWQWEGAGDRFQDCYAAAIRRGRKLPDFRPQSRSWSLQPLLAAGRPGTSRRLSASCDTRPGPANASGPPIEVDTVAHFSPIFHFPEHCPQQDAEHDVQEAAKVDIWRSETTGGC